MVKFKLLHPDTEVIGQMVIDFEEAINSNNFLPILKKHGLENVKADEWYSGQAWLDVLNEVATEGRNLLSLVSIGMKQIDNVEWPPEFETMSLQDVFQSLNPVYQSYYRGTDTGEINFEKVTDKHFKLILRVFEPDDLWYGNVYQLMKTFNKTGKHFTVSYDDERVRRDNGGENTIIHVKLVD
mgnify:CR=1 FL=1